MGSLETALTMVRDGQPLPEPVEVPEDLAPVPDVTLPPELYFEMVVEELRSLRALPVATASVAHSQAVQEPEGPSTRALLEAVSALQDQVRAQGEREGERLRVLAHATLAAQQDRPQRKV